MENWSGVSDTVHGDKTYIWQKDSWNVFCMSSTANMATIRILMLQQTCLFHTVTVNVKVFIKMK
jgi:hypothetical protein